MNDKAKGYAKKVLQDLHLGNPLRKLDDLERTALWAFLVRYAIFSVEKRDGKTIDDLEKLSRIMADAAKLGAELKSEVFGGPHSELMRVFASGFEDIPSRLVSFAARLEKTLDSFGKPGHKGKTLSNSYLVLSSEYVRLRTGHYNDEHLAELFQEIGMRFEAGELSSEAIRKKRGYLKKNNPRVYAYVLERSKRMALHQSSAAELPLAIPETLNEAYIQALDQPYAAALSSERKPAPEVGSAVSKVVRNGGIGKIAKLHHAE